MRNLLLLFFVLWSGLAAAQSSPGFIPGQTLSAQQLNQAFMTKLDVSGIGGTTMPTTDGSVFQVANSAMTARSIYTPISGGGGTIYDGVRSVIEFQSSPGTVAQVNAVAGYCYNTAPEQAYPAYGACTGVYGLTVLANTTIPPAGRHSDNGWGGNFVCSDNAAGTVFTATFHRNCIGTEIDIQTWDNGGTSELTGLLISMQGGGTSRLNSFGVNIIDANAGKRWNFGLNCDNNAVTVGCINIGVQDTTASFSQSQNLLWEYDRTVTGTKTQYAMEMYADADGGFHILTTDSAGVNILWDLTLLQVNSCYIRIQYMSSAWCTMDNFGNALFSGGGFGPSHTSVSNSVLTSTGGTAGTTAYTAWFRNSANSLIATFRDDGQITFNYPAFPTASTGGAPMYVCMDGNGVLYRKAACP
jgi:hypothetical protein